MNKKMLIIIISSVLAAALIITGAILILKSSFTGKKDAEPVITVTSVSGKVGEKVSVPVTIKNNPGFMAMLLEFNYDTSALKYKGYTKGDFLKDYQFSDDNGTLLFLNLENGDVKKDGVLVNLEFEILKSGSNELKINVAKDAIANEAEELITAKGVNGKIKGK